MVEGVLQFLERFVSKCLAVAQGGALFRTQRRNFCFFPVPFFVILWLSYFDIFSLMWEHFLDETANGHIGRAEGKIMLVCNRQYSWDYQMPMSLIVYFFAVAPSSKSPQIGNLHCRRW